MALSVRNSTTRRSSRNVNRGPFLKIAMTTVVAVLATLPYSSSFVVVVAPRRPRVARSTSTATYTTYKTTTKTSLSMALSIPNARGSAAVPFEKKRVAVMGAGGYLGAVIFGFLQRAGALYGTGLAGAERGCPVGVCATAVGSASLNKILTGQFRLAYAPENLLRLTDATDPDYMSRSLARADVVVLGTSCLLIDRPVTGGTFETSPNSKTKEFYLGGVRGYEPEESSRDDDDEDDRYCLTTFRNVLQACAKTGTVKHVVAVQTIPKGEKTALAKEYAAALDDAGLPFTYVCTGGAVENTKDYNYEMGVLGKIDLETLTLSENYREAAGYEPGDWSDALLADATAVRCDGTLATEDLAALVTQIVMSLDWRKSRVVDVGSLGPLGADDPTQKRNMNSPNDSSRYWVKYSEVLETKLAAVEE